MTKDPVVKRVIMELELTARTARETHRAAKAASLVAGQVVQDAMDAAAAAAGSHKATYWHAAFSVWCNGTTGKAAQSARYDAYDAHALAQDAYWAAKADSNAARECRTLADLLTCDRQAVRLAAQFARAPAPTVTAPIPRKPRKR